MQHGPGPDPTAATASKPAGRALQDFEAYWIHACTGMGGHVDTRGGLRMYCPEHGPPLHAIMRWEGDLHTEVQAWIARGVSFGVTAHDPEQIAVCQAAGMVPRDPYHLVEMPARSLGPPEHEIRWGDVEAFVPIQMEAHDIPGHVKEGLLQGMRRSQQDGILEVAVALDPEPAAGAILFTGGGHAGMYGFSTLASHRRRGLGTSLYKALIDRAVEQGLQHVCGVTTPDGLALARSLGATPGPLLQQFLWFPDGGPS